MFTSGFAIMAGEILWVREIGLRFGDTVLSASIVIAIFFAFAALGTWCGGRDSQFCLQPLCRFAVVEMLIGVSALARSGRNQATIQIVRLCHSVAVTIFVRPNLIRHILI